MSWYLGEEMCWSRGWTEGFLNHSNIHLLSTSSAEKKSEPCKGEIRFFRSWNTLPCAQNFKPNIWISNFVGTKFSCWHLGISSFWLQLGSYLGLEIPRDSSERFLFGFTCRGLLDFSVIGELHVKGDSKPWHTVGRENFQKSDWKRNVK